MRKIRRIAPAKLIVLLTVSVAWNCLEEPVIEIDFAKDHLVETARPSIVFVDDRDWYAFNEHARFKLRLADGYIFEQRIKALYAKRNDIQVKSISAQTPIGNREEILALATSLSADWQFDAEKLNRWYENDSDQNLLLISPHPIGNAEISMEILYSFDDDRPWFIAFQAYW